MSIFDSLKRQVASAIRREASKAVRSAVDSAVQAVGKGRNHEETSPSPCCPPRWPT